MTWVTSWPATVQGGWSIAPLFQSRYSSLSTVFVDMEGLHSGMLRRTATEEEDPSTGEVFATAPVSTAEDVDRAYAAAATAFETWGNTTPAERQQALLRLD